jgi:hypothetical protein
LQKHPVEEGFTARNALEALRNGEIVERRDDDHRCLICGVAFDLEQRPEFIATYIHCVVQWSQVENVIIITMYRPKRSDWKDHRTRRQPERYGERQ